VTRSAGVLAALVLLGAAFGCSSEDSARDVQMESRRGTTRSHFENTNCQGCHQLDDRLSPERNAPGFFTLAGTVQDSEAKPLPNATVILFDQLYDTEAKQAGNELMRLDADGLGIFYTTRPLPEVTAVGADGLPSDEKYFPAVLDNQTGIIKHMFFGVDTGACNVCHQGLYRDMSPKDDVEGDPFQQLP
jgi:hypothetical protein